MRPAIVSEHQVSPEAMSSLESIHSPPNAHPSVNAKPLSTDAPSTVMQHFELHGPTVPRPIHVDNAPGNRRRHVCSTCNRVFLTARSFANHIKTHGPVDERMVECLVCHRIFFRRDALRVHQLRTLSCIKLQEAFTDDQLRERGCITPADRKRDMRTQHSNMILRDND